MCVLFISIVACVACLRVVLYLVRASCVCVRGGGGNSKYHRTDFHSGTISGGVLATPTPILAIAHRSNSLAPKLSGTSKQSEATTVAAFLASQRSKNMGGSNGIKVACLVDLL